MEWYRRLLAEAIATSSEGFDLLYHPSIAPAVPPEYEVPGLVGLTFRLHARPRGGHAYVTVLDLGAVARLGRRLGLGAAEAVAFVDSHERIHVFLQLEGVPEDVEEAHSNVVDAVLLSLWHPEAAARVRTGEFGVVTRIEPGLFEALVERGGAS